MLVNAKLENLCRLQLAGHQARPAVPDGLRSLDRNLLPDDGAGQVVKASPALQPSLAELGINFITGLRRTRCLQASSQ